MCVYVSGLFWDLGFFFWRRCVAGTRERRRVGVGRAREAIFRIVLNLYLSARSSIELLTALLSFFSISGQCLQIHNRTSLLPLFSPPNLTHSLDNGPHHRPHAHHPPLLPRHPLEPCARSSSTIRRPTPPGRRLSTYRHCPRRCHLH